MFDERSTRGRSLNRELEALSGELSEAELACTNIEEEVLVRFRAWCRNRSGLFGSIIALVSWVAALMISEQSGLSSEELGFVAGLSSVVSGAVAFFARQSYLKNKFLRDGIVTPETGASENASRTEEAPHQHEEFSERHKNYDVQHNDRQWYHILEVPSNASSEAIKAAWREKMKQYHPDRVSDMGPELREIADRKTKELNAAYEEALKAHSNAA